MEKIEFEKGLVGTIEQDVDAQSPRTDQDNLGKMLCWHGRYTLGDNHGYSDPMEALYSLIVLAGGGGGDTPDSNLADLTAEADKYYHMLPLYLYDHSGLTIRTAPFSCPWDSGQVGFIFISKAQAVQEWGTKAAEEKVLAWMRAEVETYNYYLSGDVWYWSIEDKEGEILDSCGGFYGYEYAETEMKAAAAAILKEWKEPYSVMLLYPDHLTGGPETYYTFVDADNPAEAVKLARIAASEANSDEDLTVLPEEFELVLVTEGHNEGLNWEEK